ncbi:hypothetical protein Anas_08260 [Armadillidium nasatum]|uniref:Uncharacterized protein n=1 Tax=Armadillidium nasatum TaxID=96803 RepID=A0A5N5SQH5_9CRUS|nr:hypothetical protein Anas_08260 [Armadillidium nasatum]
MLRMYMLMVVLLASSFYLEVEGAPNPYRPYGGGAQSKGGFNARGGFAAGGGSVTTVEGSTTVEALMLKEVLLQEVEVYLEEEVKDFTEDEVNSASWLNLS